MDVAVERRERESVAVEEEEEEGKGGHYFLITHDRAEELLSWSRKNTCRLAARLPRLPKPSLGEGREGRGEGRV